MSEEEAEARLRSTLEHHLEDEVSYVRVPGKDDRGHATSRIQAFSNQSRWMAGTAASATALHTLGVGPTLAMLQGSPAEARDVAHYLASKLAPEPSQEQPSLHAEVGRRMGRGASPRPQPKPR